VYDTPTSLSARFRHPARTASARSARRSRLKRTRPFRDDRAVRRSRFAAVRAGIQLYAAQIVAYFNYINRLADGLGVDLEPDMPPAP